MSKENNDQGLTFEENLSKAKNIIDKLELGDCNLEEMLILYEEALSSLQKCNKKILEFEEHISIIKKTPDNSLKIENEK